MARKSCKHIENPTVLTHPLPLRAAVYLRIPETTPVLPPESIESQVKMIGAFLDHRPDLTLTSTYTDIDNRSFQRAGFQQMIYAIECGEIDCVIVRDLSILGRNLIEIGYYIESYFPRHSIRFISISDHIESGNGISILDKQDSKFASSDCADQPRNQIVLMQCVVGEIGLQIEQQKLLIESLDPNMQEEIITPIESRELRLAFQTKQCELVKVRDQLLQKTQQI